MILQTNERFEKNQTHHFVFQAALAIKNELPQFQEAVSALSKINTNKKDIPTLRNNPFFRVYEQYFTSEFEWNGPEVSISPDNFSSLEKIDQTVENILNIVQPIYEIADDILDAEIRGMNAHDIESHVRFVMQHFRQFMKLAEQKNGVAVPLKEVFLGVMTIVFHDLAQGLTGRKYHAKLGQVLVSQILKGSDPETMAIISKIADFVATHVTSDFRYDISNLHPESKAYAGMVLADESDIQRTRVTETGKKLLESGEIKENGDIWIFLNYLCLKSEWTLQQNIPVWNLHIDLSQGSLDLYKKVLETNGKTTSVNEDNLQAYFVDFFTREVVNGIKINLFKSAIKKIFESSEFNIRLSDQNDRDILVYYFGRSSSNIIVPFRSKNEQ